MSGSEDQVGETWAPKGPSEAVTITREPKHMPWPSSPLLGKMRLPRYFYFRPTRGSWLACSYSLKGLDEFHKNCVKGHNYVRILDLGENGIEIMCCFFLLLLFFIISIIISITYIPLTYALVKLVLGVFTLGHNHAQVIVGMRKWTFRFSSFLSVLS